MDRTAATAASSVAREHRTVRPLDHEGDKGEGSAGGLPGDLPAALGGEINPAGLEPDVAVAAIGAVSELCPQWWRGCIEPMACDRDVARYPPPPTELPADRAARAEHAARGHEHAMRSQTAHPKLSIAVVALPPEELAGRHSWWSGTAGNCIGALPGIRPGNGSGRRERRPACYMMSGRMMAGWLARRGRAAGAPRHGGAPEQPPGNQKGYPWRHRDDPLCVHAVKRVIASRDIARSAVALYVDRNSLSAHAEATAVSHPRHGGHLRITTAQLPA